MVPKKTLSVPVKTSSAHEILEEALDSLVATRSTYKLEKGRRISHEN